MRQVIIGTAGHIDHGKTAIVKALTGHDTDTLAEEKRRGITIELGFAFLDMPDSERQLVFIDVPGHEKLIRTMIAGAGNIDAVMLVIAADEGISRQTVEHVDIVKLLGIPDGVIVLTKSDLVDDSRLTALAAEVREFVSGSFLANSAILAASSASGKGIDDLKTALSEVAARVRERRDTGVFRMPVDRVFTLRGFGTVIAGTTLSGYVRVGDRVEIMPEGLSTRIRGIQVHGESVEQSGIGNRTALNVPDVRKDAIRRGQCACAPGSLRNTQRLDVRLHVLSDYDRDLVNRVRVKVHLGTDEIVGRVVLFESDTLGPGGSTYAQLVLEKPTVAVRRDPYVIRTFDNSQTIGGGIVLVANAAVRKKAAADSLELLATLESGELSDVVSALALMSGYAPVSIRELALSAAESEASVVAVVESLTASGTLFALKPSTSGDPKYLHASRKDTLSAEVLTAVQNSIKKDPYKLQLPLADIYSKLARLADKAVVDAVVEELVLGVALVRKGDRLSLPGRTVDWKPGEEVVAARVEEAFRSAGYATPSEFDLMKRLAVPRPWFERIMRVLTEQGVLVRLDDRIIWHRDSFEKAQDILVAFLKANGSATVGDLKDTLGVSRKYAVPFLEYMDEKGITRRDDDVRVLRRSQV